LGTSRLHHPVKMFAALLYQRSIDPLEIESHLEKRFGAVQETSAHFSFSHTNYYAGEMGDDLEKYIIVFAGLHSPLLLPSLKNYCNDLEGRYADSSKNRRVNIDPGYISEAKVVLATTKNFDHRLYLGDGIYGDIQLRLRKKKWEVNEWTYPDYRKPEIIDFLATARNCYWKELEATGFPQEF
jgi:hypothetical protein